MHDFCIMTKAGVTCAALIYSKPNVKAGCSAGDDFSSWPNGVGLCWQQIDCKYKIGQ